MSQPLTPDELYTLTGYRRTSDQKNWIKAVYGYDAPIKGDKKISMTPEIVHALELKRAQLMPAANDVPSHRAKVIPLEKHRKAS